ncbi:MAG: DinB family protein [Bacteroidetes bacterium]|nr:MAG: DinB family protein [Bacteroidota bacterium]
MPRPSNTEFAPFYSTYINATTEQDALDALKQSVLPMTAFLQNLPPQKADYGYATGKWTIKQVIQHCIDTERIMAYRALCVARAETQSLPGFNENEYAAMAPASHRTLEQVTHEMIHLRSNTVLLFESFSASD